MNRSVSSKISLGTAQLGLPYGVANNGGQVSFIKSKDIVKLARRSGIDKIDTAITYGNCEEVLGKIGVANWNIITKISEEKIEIDDINIWMKQQIEGALDRLGVLRLYAVMLHSTSMLSSDNGIKYWNTLEELKDQGVIEKIGYSIYDPSELDSYYNNYHPDIIQAPYNVIDNRLEASGWLQKLSDDSVEIHARSIFLQGLLLMRQDQRPAYFKKWDKLLCNWDSWLVSENITALEASLWFALKDHRITNVVVGVDSEEQLQEIIDISEKKSKVKQPDFSSLDIKLINPSEWLL